jgi:hypothetical protein
VRTGLVTICALIGFSPIVPAAATAAGGSPLPLTVTVGDDTSWTDVAYRRALLDKQSSAIDISNATIRALHEQQVQELGYEPSITEPREIARQIMVNKYSWGEDQFRCYNSIIMRESKWDPYADNPHSSAYGIPQALPGSKMAAFGSDWRTNPATQIRWGLDYVNNRYGTPCGAWSFKRAHGWY